MVQHNNLFEKLNLSKHADSWVSKQLNPDQQQTSSIDFSSKEYLSK